MAFCFMLSYTTSNRILAAYLVTCEEVVSWFASWPEVLLRSPSPQEAFPSSAVHHSNFTCSLQLFSPWAGEAGTVVILFILYKVREENKKKIMDDTSDHPYSKKN